MAKKKQTIGEALQVLTKQAKGSGESEFVSLMEFLNDQYASCNGEENLELYKAICDQYIEIAIHIKKELSKCQA